MSHTTFIGRDREIRDVRALLAQSRLLTILGPGGIGKTRLIVEVARSVAGSSTPAIFVDLASLAGNAGLVSAAVASALGLHELHRLRSLDLVIDELRFHAALLILDNCEHVAAEAAQVIDALLGACPLLSIVATTRERLHVAGEQLWVVPPLRLGAADGDAMSDAVRLFTERAKLVQPTARVDDREFQTAAAEICARLDGIPLAIELAAARLNILNVEQLARRLDRRLEVLATGSRNIPPRQQTLRATLDWSYALLDDDEQRAFNRLSVFAGPWTLMAAAAVIADTESNLQTHAVLDLLGRLVDPTRSPAQRAQDIVVISPQPAGVVESLEGLATNRFDPSDSAIYVADSFHLQILRIDPITGSRTVLARDQVLFNFPVKLQFLPPVAGVSPLVVASDQEYRLTSINATLTTDRTEPPWIITKVFPFRR